jgi:hypothetical protein
MQPGFVPGLVSVIIPTFNRGHLLGEAIDSVLAQTYRPIECVVADANSTDNTLEVVRCKQASILQNDGFKLLYVTEPDRGASASRNLGLRNCSGEFIQFLDSDDVLVCEKLNHHVQVLRANVSLDIVWSKWLIVDSEEMSGAIQRANSDVSRHPNNAPPETVFSESIPWEPWPCLFRRRVCFEGGPWNERLTRFEDWEYAVRLLATNPKIAHLPGTYAINREHQRRGVYDHPHKPDAIERGLKACREAGLAWSLKPEGNFKIAQLIAVRYWEMGLESLLLGTPQQAAEAFAGAKHITQSPKFRFKAGIAAFSLAVGGPRFARIVLSRYKYSFTMGGQHSAAHYKTSAK